MRQGEQGGASGGELFVPRSASSSTSETAMDIALWDRAFQFQTPTVSDSAFQLTNNLSNEVNMAGLA